MSIATELPQLNIQSRVEEYHEARALLMGLIEIFTDLASTVSDHEDLEAFGCPADYPHMIEPDPDGRPILAETGLPYRADQYLDALQALAPTLTKYHSPRIISLVNICKGDMSILQPSIDILETKVAGKLIGMRVRCSKMLNVIDDEILKIKSADKPLVAPMHESAINAVILEHGQFLDNPDKNWIMEQIIDRDFQTAALLRQKDWGKILKVSERTIRIYPAWISLKARKKHFKARNPNRPVKLPSNY